MADLQVPKVAQFPAKGSPQIAGNAGKLAAPGGRVVLKPGHSLLDWIRLGKSGKDLTGVGGKQRDVTSEELAEHDKDDDLWMAIKGRVYNLTHYTDFHPGGVPELMRAAGKDGTQLFDEIHKWVNYDSMLAKCLVGNYVTDNSSISSKKKRSSSKSSLSSPTPSLLANGLSLPPPPVFAKANGKPKPRHDWYQCEDYVTIVIFTKCPHIDTDKIIIMKKERDFDALIHIDDYAYRIHLELDADIDNEYNVKVANSLGKVELELKKSKPGHRWLYLGKERSGGSVLSKISELTPTFHTCTVTSIQEVTHDTNLYCVQFPDGYRMVIPLGYHVQIKINIEDMEVCKSYTVVPSAIMEEKVDPRTAKGQVLYLMIKIYSDGELTPQIGKLQTGDNLLISDFDGSFKSSRLSECEYLVMYAAGTGITPMLGLIQQALHGLYAKPNRRIKLLFFNKTLRDILWHDQLTALTEKFPLFTVTYILSTPHEGWTGSHGRISQPLVEESMPTEGERTLFCACGPTAFTNEAQRLVAECGYKEEHFHAFLG